MYRLLPILICISSPVVWGALPNRLPPGNYEPRKIKNNFEMPKAQKPQLREDALARADVWLEPAIPVERAELGVNEPAKDGFDYETEIFCKWSPSLKMGGATAKFMCTLPNGDTVKVKYAKRGKSNPEIQGEVLSSRLLRALGFGADRMYLVKKIRCFGCPEDPWFFTSQMYSPHEQIRKDFFLRYGKQDRDGRYVYEPDYEEFTDFTEIAIERRMDGKRIEAVDDQGWGFEELVKIDAKRGGASRAEVDALRLLSSFIQHSDNKPENQVLVCLDKTTRADGRCEKPLAAPQDLGSTFGSGFKRTKHSKVDVTAWESTPIWKDGTCTAYVKTSMTGGFEGGPISEEGRLFLTSLLNRVSDNQIRDLFNGVNIKNLVTEDPASRDPEGWLRVFKQKREEIAKQRCN